MLLEIVDKIYVRIRTSLLLLTFLQSKPDVFHAPRSTPLWTRNKTNILTNVARYPEKRKGIHGNEMCANAAKISLYMYLLIISFSSTFPSQYIIFCCMRILCCLILFFYMSFSMILF